MNKQELIAFIGTETTLGIHYSDGYAMLPDDFGEMGHCTNCAHFMAHLLGTGAVYGFAHDSNPVECPAIEAAGGHDYLLVNDRYIVDIWISLYTGYIDQPVFDLQDPEDAADIQHIYGPRSNWSVLTEHGFEPCT